MTAEYIPYSLVFKTPGGTSRGILKQKDTWFIKLHHEDKRAIGECGMFRGLSHDDKPDFEEKLQWTCANITLGIEKLRAALKDYPSIIFGLEIAFKSLKNTEDFLLFPSAFTTGDDYLPINGLIWMGEKEFMKNQIIDKIQEGFKCIKLKIGALDFDQEIQLLKFIRKEFKKTDIELRVDANGAFDPSDALTKLKILAEFDLHSIEQPIRQNQWEEMASLCEASPINIALDEDLIGVFDVAKMKNILQTIQPKYIILKPTLLGGFQQSEAWISMAVENDIDWWITSALESNIGLNAIAQWTYILKNDMYQGLGTGALFTNNFESPLFVKNGTLRYDSEKKCTLNL